MPCKICTRTTHKIPAAVNPDAIISQTFPLEQKVSKLAMEIQLFFTEAFMKIVAGIELPRTRGMTIAFCLLLLAPLLSACGFNTIPTYEEQAKASWSQVLNQYQRRADLIPNLVETVKAYAAHEREVLTELVEARSKATQVQLPPELLSDPEAFKRFQEGQAELSGALSRLLAIVENYPDLKANQNFLALQAQLEGTENRIAVARRDYIEAVRLYNTSLRTLPSLIWAKFWFTENQPFQNFTIEDDKVGVPEVDFGTKD